MIYCENNVPSCNVILIHACFPHVIDKDLVIKRVKPKKESLIKKRKPYLIRKKTTSADLETNSLETLKTKQSSVIRSTLVVISRQRPWQQV